MQYDPVKRRRLIIIIVSVVVIAIISIVTAILLRGDPENQFGKFIRIQNYTQKIQNSPGEVRDATESSLYNTVNLNKNGQDFNPSNIKDAFIRDSSDKQTVSDSTNVISGSYIIDMQSIKQSYRVQYSFAPTETNRNVGGSPVVITCLDEADLIYGKFTCVDLVQKQTSKDDVILQYLPFQNFTFKISPDATKNKEKLTLTVDLTIPEVDLKGDVATNRQTVQMYKDEVLKWIRSKSVNPDDYIIEYNYDDNGNLIVESHVDHDH